jgi:hypothetical protein
VGRGGLALVLAALHLDPMDGLTERDRQPPAQELEVNGAKDVVRQSV